MSVTAIRYGDDLISREYYKRPDDFKVPMPRRQRLSTLDVEIIDLIHHLVRVREAIAAEKIRWVQPEPDEIDDLLAQRALEEQP